MRIKFSDRLLHPELSNNFLSSQGKFTTETSYYNHHIKLLKNDDISWLSPLISGRLGEQIQPFIMTNTGNIFLYLPRNHAVYYYYPTDNTGDFIGSIVDGFWDWFFSEFFKKEPLEVLFGADLFHLPLKEDEILFIPPFLKDVPENYNPMTAEMALEFIDQYYC